jgi:hypothetical protein
VPKGDHGIDAHGAARGDVARDEYQQNRHARESQRIVRVNSIEHRGHETMEIECFLSAIRK